MARNGVKTGGRDFKPGNKASKGPPRLPVELKEIRKLTRPEVELRILELWEKTESEIKVVLENPQTNLKDKTIIRVMLRAVAKGDYVALGFIMDIVFGKRPESVHLTSVNQNIQTNITISQMVKNPEILKELIVVESKFRALRDGT